MLKILKNPKLLLLNSISVLFLLILQSMTVSPVSADSIGSVANPAEVKELNFVLIHGGAGNSCSFQPMADTLTETLPYYIEEYEKNHPDKKINFNILNRCYPNDESIETWASNIADAINKYLPGKKNLILIGHSMGGKVALYLTANNIGNIGDKVALVVTINSPIRQLSNYPVTGGENVTDLCNNLFIGSYANLCSSIAYYDSVNDGKVVGNTKHWLAFVSAEDAPSSTQFDYGGLDPYPWHMDDGVIPLSAQYTEDADTIYYGEHFHTDFHETKELTQSVTEKIVNYIFGIPNQYFFLAREGSFEHESDWWLGADKWVDIVGDTLIKKGSIWHWNTSDFKWNEWEDVAGGLPLVDDAKSRFEIKLVDSSPLLTALEEVRWFNMSDPEDCRLFIKTKTAPGQYVRADWIIYQQSLLPKGMERDHYEIEVYEGTNMTTIKEATWMSNNPQDLRLLISSQAESPFKRFKANWRSFAKEYRQQEIISELISE